MVVVVMIDIVFVGDIVIVVDIDIVIVIVAVIVVLVIGFAKTLAVINPTYCSPLALLTRTIAGYSDIVFDRV